MTIPIQGPFSYPDPPSYPTYPAYPPLGPTADQPPVAPRRGPGAGMVVGMIAGAGIIAMTAGVIGGGVGYLVARETLPAATAPAGSAAVPQADALPSVVPGSIADIAAVVQPAVVQLNVSAGGGDGAGSGTGSGFVISDDGYIVTNNHVAGVAADGASIEVAFSDGSTAPGRLIGANADYDLAVVKVEKTGLTTVPLGSSGDLAVGDTVIAVGSPLGLSGTVTTGIVSALDRPVTAGGEGDGGTSFINAIQTDAAINPGNSGGPLLNGNGEVIGVNSAIATMGGQLGGQAGSIGLGFAIPIDTAKRIVGEIQKTGKASTPIIGVQLDMQFAGPGAQVGEVTVGGPADAAGLQAGDLITEVDGKAVAGPTELVVAIRDNAPGDTVTLTVERDGATSEVSVTLEAATS